MSEHSADEASDRRHGGKDYSCDCMGGDACLNHGEPCLTHRPPPAKEPRCVTHHHACDCREAALAATIARLTAERDEAMRAGLSHRANALIADAENQRDCAIRERDEARAALTTVAHHATGQCACKTADACHAEIKKAMLR